MSQFIFKMPDLGEGTVEAEIVAWHTKPGDSVNEDQVIVEVMTDKAAVEVPAPVSGTVVSITGVRCGGEGPGIAGAGGGSGNQGGCRRTNVESRIRERGAPGAPLRPSHGLARQSPPRP